MILRSIGLPAALVLVGLGQSALAQATPASSTGTGTVTGHVICDDTQRPARFAGVLLFGVPAQVTVTAPPQDPNDPAAIKKALHAGLGNVNLSQGKTGLDGSFVLNDVPPGDYYAFASAPGYVAGATMVQAAYAAGADPKKLIPGVKIVHVVADRTALADVVAQRGASVSGHVTWDDGTPVSQVILQALSPGKQTKLPPEFAMLAGMGAMNNAPGMITDDQGRFRLAGLLPGEYVLKASLSTATQVGFAGGAIQINSMMNATPLVLYAPGTSHQANAKSIDLAKGEDRTGEDVSIRLGGMHSVSGRIRAVADGHGINSAAVKLTDVNDKDFSRSTGVDADGAFTVTLVPPGIYKVEVTDAEDTRVSAKKSTGLIKFDMPDTVRSYDEATGSVVVTDSDLTGQNFDLRVSAVQTKKPSVADLLKPE